MSGGNATDVRPPAGRWALTRRQIERWVTGVLRRLQLVLENPAEAWIRWGDRMAVVRCAVRNRFSRRSVLGDCDCVVSVTTYGERAKLAYVALESIARSRTRPQAFVLWLDEAEILADLPPSLCRLQRRGLQIVGCENFGPHKKQFPYAASKTRHDRPLVTADDDMVYGKEWLAGLMTAHASRPDIINAYRAREIAFSDGSIRPYQEWPLKRDDHASLVIMATGTSGVIYPARLIDALRDAGTQFLIDAPNADDVWVHSVAARHAIATRQIGFRPLTLRPVRGTLVHGTNEGTLTASNVSGGQNDVQIAQTYDAQLIKSLLADIPERPCGPRPVLTEEPDPDSSMWS